MCFFFILVGAILFYVDSGLFQAFRDFILLLVAIPAALLTDYFQKRNQFEDALRHLWSNIQNSVNDARQYTYRSHASEDEFLSIMGGLGKSIDEMRSVYKNLGESKTETGYYPFESLKIIYKVFSGIGHGTLESDKKVEVRNEMDHYWKNFKEAFLWEFDRPEPESFNTPHNFGDQNKNNFKPFHPD